MIGKGSLFQEDLGRALISCWMHPTERRLSKRKLLDAKYARFFRMSQTVFRLLGIIENAMDDSTYLTSLFQQNRGWFAGHTAFRNGMHGDGWLEKGAIIRDVSLLDSFAERQAAAIRTRFPETDLIICTGECGAIVAAAVARCLGYPIAVTISEGEQLYFHRMHIPASDQRAILVDDLIFSGTEVRRHVDFLQQTGIELLGVSAWVNRQSDHIAGVPVHSLMPPPFSLFSITDCPLCQHKVPLAFTEIRE